MKYLKLFENFETAEETEKELNAYTLKESDDNDEDYDDEDDDDDEDDESGLKTFPWEDNDEDEEDDNWNGPWMEVDDLDNDYVYDVFINDKRTPGGDTIKDDYGVIEVTYHKNGTINVEGFGKNIKDYLEDYGISSVPESDVNLIWDGDMGWETIDKK